MKNVLKGLTFASVVMLAAACKNDKPADNAASISAATQSAPTTATPTTTTPEAVAATKAVATPIAAASAAAAKAVVENVKPMSAQTTTTPVPVAAAKTTTMKFDELSYDWGSINENDKMTHIFKFKNTGVNDLIISDARGSCGCTVPEWPKEPIKAGKGGEIKVVFD